MAENEQTISRRDFLKGAALLGVATAIDACIPKKPNPVPSATEQPFPTPEPTPITVFASPSLAPSEPIPTQSIGPEKSPIPTIKPNPETTPVPHESIITPGEVIFRANPNRKNICLTFDDGGPRMRNIWEEAQKRGVKMSFLPTGNAIKADPGLYREIHATGHDIYNHTLSHPDLTTLNSDQIKTQILKGRDALWKAIGEDIPQTLIRPPFGAWNQRVREAAKELGYGLLLWDVTSAGTSRYATVDTIERRINKGLHKGAIVLEHPTAPDTGAFPTVLDNILSKGYNVVPVMDALN